MYLRYYGKIIFKAIIWSVVIIGLMLMLASLMIGAISYVFPKISVGPWFKLLSFLLTTIIIVKFHNIFLRYPFQKTFTARRIIVAPIETVWEQVRPRARNQPYNALHSSIRKVSDNIYRYFETNAGGAKKSFFDIKLIHEIPNQVLELDYADTDSPHDAVKTSRGVVYTFSKRNENQTEIVVRETHYKPSLLTFYVFEFMGAHKDDFRQLASACEGHENISWATAQIALDEIASHSDASIADMLNPIADGILIAATALITAVTMVLVWAI